ncbi:endonuclease domain-containing protein [Leucobacter salsicius]|uniref:endonuclease domain-containing protein n=1 Tax=Leucobacter salsicius TaxID=664638 RepID=UPI00037023C7|nr:DUF559 domain-containing protein [Leucobacter salsicius]
MDLISALAAEDGAMRSATALALGFSDHTVRVLVTAGTVTRPRRGWLALSSLHPELLFALSNGVVLSCVSAAQWQGLWVLNHDLPHVSARDGQHVHPINARVHRRRPLKPRQPGLLVDHLENTLDHVAACLPHEEALAIWDSAMQKNLTDYQSLAALPFKGRARAVLAECTPLSDSGLESIFRTRLRWLKISIRPQAWVHGHRVDFLLGDRLVVQIDGKQHEGAQRTSDRKHDADLMRRGYYVIRVGYAEVVYDWNSVEAGILDAYARGLHLTR